MWASGALSASVASLTEVGELYIWWHIVRIKLLMIRRICVCRLNLDDYHKSMNIGFYFFSEINILDRYTRAAEVFSVEIVNFSV